MSQPAEAEPSPLAAMISSVAEGNPVTNLDRDILKLKLVGQAQQGGASWALIARALKYPSGREAKRDIHKLRDRVKRAERLGSAP